MEKIKCIFVDIDGTLMKEGVYKPETISEANIEALKSYAEEGGKIILSTGRDVNDTIKVAEYLAKFFTADAIPYLVCLNGGVIVKFVDDYPIKVTRYFEASAIESILSYLIKRRYNFFLGNTSKELYFTNKIFSRFIFWILFKKKFERKVFRKDMDLSKVQKIMIFLKLPRVKCVRRKLVAKFGEYFYFSSGPHFFIEIIDNRVNKWFAAQEVMKLLDVKSTNVAVIGNEGNDILALENAGFGIGVDLWEKQYLNWDKQKIEFHVTNKKSEAVSDAIRQLKKLGLY